MQGFPSSSSSTVPQVRCSSYRKIKEKLTLFSDHNRSLLRQQIEAVLSAYNLCSVCAHITSCSGLCCSHVKPALESLESHVHAHLQACQMADMCSRCFALDCMLLLSH